LPFSSRAARRQLRVAEIQLDSRLEAEHEVSRAKDEFIANMSHELRTPLTSIYGFSEVLLEQGLLDPAGAMELVGMINSESAELGRMVEDLLVSARSEAGTLALAMRPVDIATELEAVLVPLRRSSHRFESDLDEAPVWADPLRVRQILRNLLSNAVRHGGTTITVSGHTDNGRVTIVVADDGDGVPQELVPRLFTRFVHEGSEALTEGSVGLGLAVVKSLTDAMDGTVAHERSGGWTKFVFSLPLAGEDRDIGEHTDGVRRVA
jgi:two-component system OmpR family sensor kinase